MKKVLAIVAIVMLVPFTAFGMEMMHDTALEEVTGQAGVSISIDNVQMDFSLGYVAWGDDDGFETAGTGGYVNMSTIRMTDIVIDKLGMVATFNNSGILAINPTLHDGTALDGTLARFLTIDVGTYASALNADFSVNTTDTAVRIGVPTLTVYVGTIDPITVGLTYAPSATVATGDTLGTIAMGSMQLDTKTGNLYILAH